MKNSKILGSLKWCGRKKTKEKQNKLKTNKINSLASGVSITYGIISHVREHYLLSLEIIST